MVSFPGDLGRVADGTKLFFLRKCKIVEKIMHFEMQMNVNESMQLQSCSYNKLRVYLIEE